MEKQTNLKFKKNIIMATNYNSFVHFISFESIKKNIIMATNYNSFVHFISFESIKETHV